MTTPVYSLLRFREMLDLVKPKSPQDRRKAIRDLRTIEEAYSCADQSAALKKRAKALVDAALGVSRGL